MNSNSKISAVIFDMDGLMFDTESLFSIVQNKIAKRRGKEFTLEIKGKMMGQKALHAIEIMLRELGIEEDPTKVFQEQNKEYLELLRNQSQPMPGLIELLNFLEENQIRKCIATSSMREWVNILMTRFHLGPRFEFIITGEDVTLGKPNPEMYLKAVDQLNILASNCLVLEDSSNGVRAGKSAGCFTVAVPTDLTRNQDFSMADLIVRKLNDNQLLSCIIVK